jgi:hypothetical protein
MGWVSPGLRKAVIEIDRVPDSLSRRTTAPASARGALREWLLRNERPRQSLAAGWDAASDRKLVGRTEGVSGKVAICDGPG